MRSIPRLLARLNSISIVISVVLLLPSVAAAVPQFADAMADVAPPPAPYWQAEIPTGTVEHPADQPLIIPAWMEGDLVMWDASNSLDYVQLNVTDQQGTPLSGRLTYDGDARALVWTPDAPFVEGATYMVSVLFENDRMNAERGTVSFYPDVTGEFTVSIIGEAGPLTDLTILDASLVDYETYSGSACCDEGEAICQPGAGFCSNCVTYAISSPRIELRFTNEVPGAPWVYFRVYEILPDGTRRMVSQTYDLNAEIQNSTVYPSSVREQYCVEVEAVALADGMTLSETVCLDDASRMKIPLPGPEELLAACQPAPEDMMETPPMEPDVLELDASSPDGGSMPNQVGDESVDQGCACSTVQHPSSSFPLGAVFALVGLLALWVRRTE